MKIRSKHSSNTLVSLLRIFMKQTLFQHTVEGTPYPFALDFCNSLVRSIQFNELDFFPSFKSLK